MEYYSYNCLLIFEINTKVNRKISVFWEFTLPILADIYDFQKNPLPHSSELFPLISLYLFVRLDGVIIKRRYLRRLNQFQNFFYYPFA